MSLPRKSTPPRNRALSADELDRFAVELDGVRARTVATLGQRDADYIRAIVKAVRYTGFAGRLLLMAGAIGGAFVPAVLVPAWIAGVLLLALSKILENMELGHNVMHGQYDWMRDPHLDGKTYEWDIAGTGDNWRKTHNFKHHTYTNVRGMDDDIGYGLLRIFPEQRWKPFYLLQPVIAVIFALLFEWGVAIQDLRLGRWLFGKTSNAQMRKLFRPVGRKMARQVLKDYVLFPLLAGPFFLPVLLGNVVANVLRNLWTYTIIFCGHFTADVETFSKDSIKGESRGHWYLRQLRGSSNLTGGKLMDLMSGNLSHQIEHHFYPDVPANRYAAMAVEVREICERYGQLYNTGSLPRQFGQVIWRILRHALPSRPVARKTRLLHSAS
ncbi:fatty acid desaturase family protein [Lysobacter niastensis]|uniref:Acyl-CoA desaturase n=1 Tax=Lysobacter niastensis TaxID=380629 RepID=A0ABS0B937_9GAMM|nr:acyl-CoA desaturase [Lysobacter niastensis]MBF6025433.1 acyl-CoA desaturase [Lysobacter niastensis]